MRTKHAGFTLVEIAIVLVIIGLLLGGILKGQEMIVQAKIKNAMADLSGTIGERLDDTVAYRQAFSRTFQLPRLPLTVSTASVETWPANSPE